MSKASVIVHKCIQDIHNVSGNDSVVMSKVFFSVSYDGHIYNNLDVTISQNFGIDYSNDPLEVHQVEELDINLDYGKFSDEIENYYRSLVGSSDSSGMINIGSGVNGLRMRDNTFLKEYTFDINVIEPQSSGW